MRVVVPAEPVAALTGAWRTCVGTGRMNLALRHDSDDTRIPGYAPTSESSR